MPDMITTINPSTGASLTRYDSMGWGQIDAILDSAAEAQSHWAALDIKERCEILTATAALLRERKGELASLAVAEMGKPIAEALAEVEKCAWVCDYYAQEGPTALADEFVEASGSRSWTSYEPIGTVLAIMPWNYPYWQVFRFAAPALAAGNAALLKHSPNVSGCAVAIQRVFRRAGLPDHLFTTLLLTEAAVPELVPTIIADDRVAAVTVTGSNRAGAQVAMAAGKAVKKSVLELGGSDPFVILGDADLEAVIPKAVASRFLNGGQSCLSAKRFIVERSIAEEFAQRFASAVGELAVGDPTKESTKIGPLARVDLAIELDRQVQESIAAGARALVGGTTPAQGSAYYSPTVLIDVTTEMPVMAEETFGPAAAVIAFDSDDEAIQLANLTPYGLGASVWSRDEDRALAIGRKIQSGALFVNAVVASDPRLPFGGVKQSGYGRELGTPGAREFTNVRTVLVG